MMAYRKTAKVLEHLESLRERFLKATMQDITEKGVDALNMKLVAKRARLPVGTIYKHFADREELIAAAMHRRRILDIELMRRAAATSGAGAPAIKATLVALLSSLETPALARALFCNAAYRIAVRDQLAAILASNAAPPKDAAKVYAAGAIGVLFGMATAGLAEPANAPEAISMALRAMACNGKVPA